MLIQILKKMLKKKKTFYIRGIGEIVDPHDVERLKRQRRESIIIALLMIASFAIIIYFLISK